ncbi:MAG TPA: transglutaminase-like domain-containing protein, partial [Gemmataceae bacterium]|nr:transglutaminase-like domain-containing protein [Gemmataceae bacterium]
MSRTTLCVLTAAVLVALSLGVALVRCQVLGDEARMPVGANTWKVTMVVQGHSLGDAKLQTATPLDIDRQHVLRETWRSSSFLDRPPSVRQPQRRLVHWTQRAGTGEGPFRARYEFFCTIDVRRATPSMSQLHAQLYAAPEPGKHLDPATYAAGDNERISAVARRLTEGIDRSADQVEALYRYVAMEIANEPSTGGPGTKATECLENGSGDAGGKSRLLVALLRNRGVPARMVTGLTLTRGPEQLAHRWVEAWVDDRWIALCPFHRHYGHVPPTYLIIGFGDLSIARGRNVRDLAYAFLVERTLPDDAAGVEATPLRRAFRAV